MLSRLILLLALITSFAHAEVYEPKPGSAERKAIMDALRLPVSIYVGTPVTFTGNVEVSGNWAKFTGGAAPTDGKAPKTDKADEMELDLFALLRKQDGAWKVLSWAFSGDISAYQDALQKFPKAPKDLMPPLE
jgi:methionine-rich copper-binding protein CopC